MTRPQPLVSARSVGVYRGGRWLIHDVSLDIHAGEVVTVVGPNGAGKSTLLETLLGLRRPDAGSANPGSYSGADGTDRHSHCDAFRCVGPVPFSLARYPPAGPSIVTVAAFTFLGCLAFNAVAQQLSRSRGVRRSVAHAPEDGA